MTRLTAIRVNVLITLVTWTVVKGKGIDDLPKLFVGGVWGDPLIECRGSIQSLVAIPCISLVDCTDKKACLENDEICSKDDKIHIHEGRPGNCSINDPNEENSESNSCFVLTYDNLEDASAIIKCTPNVPVLGSGSRPLFDHYYLGIDDKYRLLSKSSVSMIQAAIKVDGHPPFIKNRDGPMTFYTNEEVKIDCSVVKILNGPDLVKMSGIFENGTSRPIELLDPESLFYLWEVSRKQFRIPRGLSAIHCGVKYNSTLRISAFANFTVVDPGVPVILNSVEDKMDRVWKMMLGEQKKNFQCNFTGGPGTVRWFHNDQEVTHYSFSKHTKFYGRTRAGIIDLPKITYSAHGIYKCRVSNEFGSAEHSFHVAVCTPSVDDPTKDVCLYPMKNVIGSLVFQDEAANMSQSYAPPSIHPMRGDDNIVVKEMTFVEFEQNRNLTCKATGVPLPNVVWVHNQMSLKETLYKVNGTSKESIVMFPVVQAKNAGVYKCLATNIMGNDAWHLRLNVNQSSSLRHGKDILGNVSVPENGTFSDGENIKLKDSNQHWLIFGVIAVVCVILVFGVIGFFLFRSKLFPNKTIHSAETVGLNQLPNSGSSDQNNETNDAVGSLQINLTLANGSCLDLQPVMGRREIGGIEFELDDLDHQYETIPEQDLNIYKVLGEGKFGLVVQGNLNSKVVAVKKPKRDLESIKNLWMELKILRHIGKHPNIVEFLGAVRTNHHGERTGLLVMELSPLGSLKSFLEKNRSTFYVIPRGGQLEPNSFGYARPKVTTINLVHWCVQIARGMRYLESRHIVHRDLGIRNVLLFEKDVVKIADFGLSSKLEMYAQYMRQTETIYVQWRYMSPEALCEGKYSSKSDVWSYGVTIWEIFTLGEEPYAQFDNIASLKHDILQGNRLPQPQTADDDVYDMMLKCWHGAPERRPSFAESRTIFAKILKEYPLPEGVDADMGDDEHLELYAQVEPGPVQLYQPSN